MAGRIRDVPEGPAVPDIDILIYKDRIRGSPGVDDPIPGHRETPLCSHVPLVELAQIWPIPFVA
jgi:7,8-dihydro-6-hydroxymethylpterin-pyrophosphokinase